MRKFAVLLAAVAIGIACAGALQAATSIYGVSGLIETPDDSIVTAKSVTPAADRIFDFKPRGAATGVDITTFGGAVGISSNLEVSAVGIDSDAAGVKTEGLINAKYRLLDETVATPSVTIGVVDAAQRLKHFVGTVTEASGFIVFEKNISSIAEGVSGQVSKPVRGTVGFGTGLYRSAFAGLNISVAPKFNVAVEYLPKGLRDEDTVSGVVRFQPIEALSIDAGAVGFKDFYAGASFNLSTF
jgi:hypothetical protein